MKYCTKCFEIIKDGEACPECSGSLLDLKPQTSVKVCTVKGSLKPMIEPALKEKGIPCDFFNPEMDIYNQLNPKVAAETDFSLRVPFEFYSEAFDTCAEFGFVDADDKIDVSSDTQTASDRKNYDQKFEDVTGTKRKVFSIIWIILFIVVACLLIWGIDYIAALIKGSMGIPTRTGFINLL